MLRIPSSWLLVALIAVSVARAGAEERSPHATDEPCPSLSGDTTGWERHTSSRGKFSLLLPFKGIDVRVHSVDSTMGEVHGGAWILAYDRGEMAGPGTVRLPPGAIDGVLCDRDVGSLKLHLKTYKSRGDAKDGAAGPDVLHGVVGVTVAPRTGLYLAIETTRPSELAAFFVAAGTLELPPRKQPNE